MPKKVAMIGAGSIVFCRTLLNDILATPALADSEIALMSRTAPKLRAMEDFAARMVRGDIVNQVVSDLDEFRAHAFAASE